MRENPFACLVVFRRRALCCHRDASLHCQYTTSVPKLLFTICCLCLCLVQGSACQLANARRRLIAREGVRQQRVQHAFHCARGSQRRSAVGGRSRHRLRGFRHGGRSCCRRNDRRDG